MADRALPSAVAAEVHTCTAACAPALHTRRYPGKSSAGPHGTASSRTAAARSNCPPATTSGRRDCACCMAPSASYIRGQADTWDRPFDSARIRRAGALARRRRAHGWEDPGADSRRDRVGSTPPRSCVLCSWRRGVVVGRGSAGPRIAPRERDVAGRRCAGGTGRCVVARVGAVGRNARRTLLRQRQRLSPTERSRRTRGPTGRRRRRRRGRSRSSRGCLGARTRDPLLPSKRMSLWCSRC